MSPSSQRLINGNGAFMDIGICLRRRVGEGEKDFCVICRHTFKNEGWREGRSDGESRSEEKRMGGRKAGVKEKGGGRKERWGRSEGGRKERLLTLFIVIQF